MDQDELAQDGIQGTGDTSEDKPEAELSPAPLATDTKGEDFDPGKLESPFPFEEDTFTEPSRLRLFLGRLLRWMVAILVIFAMGIAATWFARVNPQQKEIKNLEHQLEQVRSEADQSASQVDDLLPLVDENAKLKSDLSKLDMHVELLTVQADVASARLALLAEDIVTAKASLVGTDTRLEALMGNLDGEDRNTVDGMLTRLELVLEELGDDSFAAMRDLEVLSSNLAALERSIFGN